MSSSITAAEAARVAEQNKPTVISITNEVDERIKNAMTHGERFTSISYSKSTVSISTLEDVKKGYLKKGFEVQIFTESPNDVSFIVRF
ncbi:hypothetical protein [Acinetobacter oleivorans]|uniref:hypothetical protein n=1 Tax=Acinetobacter oleivorans TaxID=1148157 RepID=UPI00226CCA58|nr:hypothetical protein [Acinetobacter oleivorans]